MAITCPFFEVTGPICVIPVDKLPGCCIQFRYQGHGPGKGEARVLRYLEVKQAILDRVTHQETKHQLPSGRICATST